jgi:hypothetical protein
MTANRKLAMVMGKITAEDAVKSIQNPRCIPELVPYRSGPEVVVRREGIHPGGAEEPAFIIQRRVVVIPIALIEVF